MRPFVPLLDESLEYVDPSNDARHVSSNPFEWFEVKHVLDHLVDPFTMLTPSNSRSESKKPVRKKAAKTPPRIEETCPDLLMAQYKYWQQRFLLFSLYDQGIHVDPAGWYSVTPELVALHQVRQCEELLKRDKLSLNALLVFDPFAGVGGNVIQFARTAGLTIGADISEERLEMARHNSASVYSVFPELVLADVTKDHFRKGFTPDILFASPPWGGPAYSKEVFDPCAIDLGDSTEGMDFWSICSTLSKRSIYFLPRNTNIHKLAQLFQKGYFLVESNMIDKSFKGITVYRGFRHHSND